MLKFTCNVRPIFLGVPENSLKERSTFGTYKKKVTCDRRSERGSNCTWPSMRGVLRDRSGSLEAFLLTSTEAHTGSNIYWCSRLCIYLLISCNRQLIKKKFTRSISLCAIECPYIIKKINLYVCWGKISKHGALRVPVHTEFTNFQLLLPNKLLSLWMKSLPFMFQHVKTEPLHEDTK